MLNDEAVENSLTPVAPPASQVRGLTIPNVAPVKLHTLDLARHVAVAPNGRRYVVGTSDDTHIGRGYVTTAYPQQNGYLTLVRLPTCHVSAETPELALQNHLALVQALQSNKLKEFLKAHQQKKQ